MIPPTDHAPVGRDDKKRSNNLVSALWRAIDATQGGSAGRVESPTGIRTLEEIWVDACEVQRQLSYRISAADSEPIIAVGGSDIPATISAMAGILAVGGTYLPIDFGAPGGRVDRILTDAKPELAITTSPDIEDVLSPRIEILSFTSSDSRQSETPTQQLMDCAQQPSAVPLHESHRACVMYTSGSSGRPKGVEVLHGGILRLAEDSRIAGVLRGSRLGMLAPMMFDASHFEIWGTLLSGGTLVVPSSGVESISGIGEFVRDRRIEVLWLTSGLFSAVMEADPEALGSLRHILVGGDVVAPRAVRGLMERGVTVWNGYGPTENTTFTTIHQIKPADVPSDRSPVPIGRPIDGTAVWILDDLRRPYETVECEGELAVSGRGLSRGYLHNPELTSERFVVLDTPAGAVRVYLTGDVVRRDEGGLLHFVGRHDRQVKVAGVRVELDEVEILASEIVAVTQAAAVTIGEEAATRRIALYLGVGDSDAESVRSDVRNHLTRNLPSAAVPGQIEVRPALPLTSSGKIDRAGLTPGNVDGHFCA